MLNLKKVIASICVIAMVLTTVAFGATYTDVTEDSVYYEAVETLTKLDIVDGKGEGLYAPEEGVTRAEMAKLIACVQGYGETAAGSAVTNFTDVPSSHWASGYIANAAGMGIVNGYGDGTFGPDDPVLYEQVIKMVMATLGYTPFAEKNGGWPTGYLAAAQRYSVSLAVSNAVVGQEANRGTVAQLLVNALDTPMMIQSSWNTDGIGTDVIDVGYTIADGTGGRAYRTLMSENLGYVKIRGIVEENAITNIDGTKNIDTSKDAEVVINVRDSYKTTNKDFENIDPNTSATWADKTILANGTEVADYLGQSVIGYVKKLATDKYEMVSVAVDVNRNDVLKINLANYAGISGDEISYYKDGANDTTEVKLASGTIDLVINGASDTKDVSYLSTLISSVPSKFGGEIVLIDNDTTKGYDVAFVNLAATAVVKKITANGIALYNPAKIGGSGNARTLYVYPDDETKVFTIYKDGAEVDYTELNEWDVLSVYAYDATSDVMTAEVISSEVVGTITSEKKSQTSAFPSGAGNGKAYKVGDNWYDVAEGAYQEGLEIGAGGKFYIDEFGKIAAFIEDAALAGGVAGNFGYVMAVAAEEKSFGSTGAIQVKVQMLTEDGVEILTLKHNAKLNESPSTSTQLPINDWTWSDGDSDGKVAAGEVSGTAAAKLSTILGLNTVVKFTKDSNDYLSSITLAGYSKSGDAEFTAVSGGANDEFDADSYKLGSRYITDDAMIFIVSSDEAKCKVVSAADLGNKDKYDVTGGFFMSKSSEDYDMAVISALTFNAASVSSNVAVITGVSTGADDENNTIFALTFLQDGEEKTLYTTEEVYSAINGSINAGDVVKIKTTGDVISNVTFVFDFTEDVRDAGAIAGSNGLDGAIETTYLSGIEFINTAAEGVDEKFIGGKVIGYKDSSEVATFYDSAFATDTKDANGDPGTDGILDTVNTAKTAEIKLGRGVNYYTIDNTGYELVITAEGGSTFNNLSDAIYTAGGLNDICGKDGNIVGGLDDVSDDIAQTYADYVYVRTYEDKVIDVIVVKGAKNIIVK